MNKNKHGGQRSNAGRPILPNNQQKTGHSISLTSAQRRYALRLGKTIGEGIRRLLDAARGAGK